MKHSIPLHIVSIITKLELGGAQKICLTLYKELQSYNITTSLITGSGGILDETVSQQDTVFFIDSFHREISSKKIVQEIKTFFRLIALLRALKKKHPHIIVHTHSTKAGIIGRWAAFFARIPIRIHTIHGYAFHNYQRYWASLLIYCIELVTSFITTHYICVSSADMQSGSQLFPFFSTRSTIIRAGIDWDQFSLPIIDKNTEPFIFGTVACFKPQKNIFDLLNAFALTHQKYPFTQLVIIGDGLLRKAFQKWIDNHALNHAITLLGWQNNVASFMQHWHVFTLSSLWEGLPCAIVEARKLGLPVISYDIGGIRDVIFHGHNGLLYQPHNWQALAYGMQILCENKTFYNQLAHYKDNLDDFNYAAMIRQHHDLYKTLCLTKKSTFID